MTVVEFRFGKDLEHILDEKLIKTRSPAFRAGY